MNSPLKVISRSPSLQPFLSFQVGHYPDFCDVILTSVTPEDLEAAAVELRTAREVHRLAAIQAGLAQLEPTA